MRTELLDLFCTFLEASIHQLLHNRGVYPPELFERTKFLNIPVHRVRSQELCDYIHDIVSSSKPWLQQDRVEGMVLQMTDAKSGAMLENFVFELQGTSALCSHPRATTTEVSADMINLESILRSFLIKTTQAGAALGGKLEALPETNTSTSPSAPAPILPISWKIFILSYEVEEGETVLSAMPWIEADSNELSVVESTKIIPLRSHTPGEEGASPFKLQLFVEKLQSTLP